MKHLTLLLCLLLHIQAFAQPPRKLKQDARFELKIETQSLVLTPSPIDSAAKYPLVVFLPFTGGSAKNYYETYLYQASGNEGGMGAGQIQIDFSRLVDSLKRMPTDEEVNSYILQEIQRNATRKDPGENDRFNVYLQGLFGEEVKKKAFIALIPGGVGSTNDHSWEGFEACIYRYENKILQDIDSLSKIYNIDHSKIILAGFSLGGDLGWAISQRYPEKFRGALVNGSRCGYSEKGMMLRQAKKGVKYYIAMGELEPETRMKGAKAAVAALNKAAIKNKFATTPAVDHQTATFEQFKEALNFLLFE